MELVNCTAATNRDITSFQEIYKDLDPPNCTKPNIAKFKVIGAHCEVFIPEEKRSKGYKLAPRTKARRLVVVLGTNTYLVYIPRRHTVVQTSQIKIFEQLKVPIQAKDQELEELEGGEGIESSTFRREGLDSTLIPQLPLRPEQPRDLLLERDIDRIPLEGGIPSTISKPIDIKV